MVVDIIALQQQGLNCKTFFVSRIILGSVYDIAILATNIRGTSHLDSSSFFVMFMISLLV